MPAVLDDVMKCVWQVKVDGIGTRVQNVFYWQINPLNDGDEQSIAVELGVQLGAVYANISDWLSLDYILEEIRITNDSQKTFAGLPPEVFAGAAAADTSTPAQVAVQVLARAKLLGHTARKYVGPVIEAAHVNGSLVAGALADFGGYAVNWATGFVGGGTANGYLPVMVSHVAGGAIGTITPIDEDLTTVTAVARTQRRRIPGRGLS